MKFSQQAVLNASPSRYESLSSPLFATGRSCVERPLADLALPPGRYLVSVARTALEGLGDEPKSAVQPSSTVARRRSASGPDLAHWG